MPIFKVQFFIDIPNGEPQRGQELTVNVESSDALRAEARRLAKEHHLPAIRSMSHGPGNKLLVFCAHNPAAATPPEDLRHRWKRPPGPAKI